MGSSLSFHLRLPTAALEIQTPYFTLHKSPIDFHVPHVQPGYVDCNDFIVESVVPVDLDTSSDAGTSHQSNPPDINLRRSTRISKPPSYLNYKTALNASHISPVISHAVQFSHWITAMNVELEALERNGTWDIVPLPAHKKAIGSKWLFKTKYKFDDTIERYKSRLVVLGCKQQLGVDYLETFAPVAKFSTMRALLALDAVYQLSAVQMDVTNAFLHGDLREEVYMTLPQGYTRYGCRISSQSTTHNPKTNLVYKLKKSMYGLKQAPKMWFCKLSDTLLCDDYVQSKCDPSLFTKTTTSSITLILIYVDDLLLAGDSATAI
ncbi:hypothetical protein AgCh_033880 [Apium graveolens]